MAYVRCTFPPVLLLLLELEPQAPVTATTRPSTAAMASRGLNMACLLVCRGAGQTLIPESLMERTNWPLRKMVYGEPSTYGRKSAQYVLMRCAWRMMV